LLKTGNGKILWGGVLVAAMRLLLHAMPCRPLLVGNLAALAPGHWGTLGKHLIKTQYQF
jgi:hypothetical protein